MQKRIIGLNILLALLLMAKAGWSQRTPMDNSTIDGDESANEAMSISEDVTTVTEEGPVLAKVAMKEDAAPKDKEPVHQSDSKIGIAAAAKVGVTFHTIFNALSPMLLLEVEGGVLLLDRHLEIDMALAWARPKATTSKDDARLPNDSYDWEIKQDFLSLGIVGRYRFLDRSSRFNVYGALGPGLLMLRTKATGDSGSTAIGTNKQYETRFGGCGALGGEFNIGQGAIVLEAGMTFGVFNGYITGDTSAASLDIYLGYRFMFDL
ncbi:MAG: outer membrane beta-barrel protein [Deltaproteobacteria bacterium]|nr:outer membrane beta-barrel protein [Deltaproteobacteria bacterium]